MRAKSISRHSFGLLFNISIVVHLTCLPTAFSTCDEVRLHLPCSGPLDDCGCTQLECSLEQGICVRNPRDYGEPCSFLTPCGEYSVMNPSMPLRCSPTCGMCVASGENDVHPSTKKGEDEIFKVDSSTTPHRCLSLGPAGTFRTWARTVLSSHPIVKPTNDQELAEAIQAASSNGCKVRPMGSTHSATGVVVNNDDEDVVVISLDDYSPSSSQEWNSIRLNEQNGRVRVPAGRTQLELYSVIRPQGYFLPTQTAGWLFTIGGIVSNSVHGGHFDKSYIHSYVTKMRVMYANGTISTLTEEQDLRMWRNSFGLFGIITAVEFQLEKIDTENTYFWMGVDGNGPTQLNGGWNSIALNQYVNRIKSENMAGQFFFEPTTKEFLTLVQQTRQRDVNSNSGGVIVNDGDCTWNIWQSKCECTSCSGANKWTACSYQYQFGDLTLSTSCRSTQEPTPSTNNDCAWDYPNAKCRNEQHCSYQFEAGDMTLDESCRLTDPPPPSIAKIQSSYQSNIAENPLLGFTGSPIGKDQWIQELSCQASRWGLERIMRSTVMTQIQRLVKEAYESTNDGFFVTEGSPLPAAYLAYMFPSHKLFNVLDQISAIDNFILTAPLEFRFVTLDDSALLMPGNIRSGEYVFLEAPSIEIPGWTPQRWRKQFQQIEDILRGAGGFPHTGKFFGMGRDSTDGVIKPFQDVRAGDIFNDSQKYAFNEYRLKVDPKGLFYSGFMADYLQMKDYW